jgi:hypothetical protein
MAYIYRNPHRQALLGVEQEITQRQQEIAFATARLRVLEQARKSLLPLARKEADEEMEDSLPTLCLRVLSLTPNHGVSIPKIREGLLAMGIEVTGKNPLGIIHTAMGRLAKNGYIAPAAGTREGATHFQITPAGLSYLQQGN